MLVLPGSCALSDKEARQIPKFLNKEPDHAVLTEGLPGLFDEHAKLHPESPLEGLVGTGALSNRQVRALFGDGHRPGACTNSTAQYAVARLKDTGGREWSAWLARQIRSMQPPVSVSPEARARIRRFKLGRNRLLGIERNINYQMSEQLKQAGGNEALEKRSKPSRRWGQPMHIYNLWTEDYLG